MKLTNNLRAAISNLQLITNNYRNYSTNVNINPISPGLENSRKWNKIMPSINFMRNNRRLSNTFLNIGLYLDNQSGLPNEAIMALQDLISYLRTVYRQDPYAFVTNSKTLGNWFKVNIFRAKRTRDAIPLKLWDSWTDSPVALIEVISTYMGLKNDKDKLMFIRMVLSIFDVYRSIITPTQPQTDTIIAPGIDVSSVITDFDIKAACDLLELDPQKLTALFNRENRGAFFHSTSAQGPNGQAVWNSHLDAMALKSDESLFKEFTALCKLIGREDLLTVVEEAAKLPNLITPDDKPLIHSKLHVIWENGDKARVIAILDYFTQEVLKPFHDIIAGILKLTPQDGTFDQNKIAELVRGFTKVEGTFLASFDLKAATDRLPITVQRRIINHLFKVDGFALLWQKLLTFREFTLDDGSKYKYAVGQPMGALSSFPMLGLTHHVLVQISAIRAGFTSVFRDYVILGDDIVIANSKVAEKYEALMKSLGLEISNHKTIISSPSFTTSRIAEICRRVFVDGNEITPLPVKLIANVFENSQLFLQLQEKLAERGLINNPSTFEEYVAGFKLPVADFNRVVLMNTLPNWLTKLSQVVNFNGMSDHDFRTWTEIGIDEDMLLEFWKYTVISEQFKRLSTLVQSAENGFKAISKAINLGDILFVQDKVTSEKIPARMFTLETLQQWNIMKVAHPARFVMLKEVDRISTIMRRLASARGKSLFLSLMDGVIDLLKYSILEVNKDKMTREAQVQRALIDKTLNNLRAAKLAKNNTLSFSVKLDAIGVVWVLRVSLNGSCTLSEQVMRVPSTTRDAQVQLKSYQAQNMSFKDLFKS